MKNLFTKMFAIMAMFLFGSALVTSCVPDAGTEDDGPGVGNIVLEPNLALGEPNIISAIMVELPITATDLLSVGYKVDVVDKGVEFPKAPSSAALVFRSGKKLVGEFDDSRGVYKFPERIALSGNDGLDRDKKVKVYVAATTLSGKETVFYNDGEILTIEFETPDNYSDEEVIILRKSYEGADVFVQVPEKVKAENRRIRWTATNAAWMAYNGNPPIVEGLHRHDGAAPSSLFKNDTILNINDFNAVQRDENGEIIYSYAGYDKNGQQVTIRVDENDPLVEAGTAQATELYSPFKPGAPLVLCLSEVYYADCVLGDYEDGANADHRIENCDKYHPTINWQWGPGWYCYPYDLVAYSNALRGDNWLPDMGVGGSGSTNTIDPNQFWWDGAWYKIIEDRLPGPEKFESTVKVDIKNLTSENGEIYFTPDKDVFAYHMVIQSDADYMNMVLNLLGGDASLVQWFMTTEDLGPFIGGIYTIPGDNGTITKINLTDAGNGEDYWYTSALEAGTKYHILVNAVPGKMKNGDMVIDPTRQNFQHITFPVPDYKYDAPELIVTPYEAYSPFKVKYNIKKSSSSLPVKKVAYAFNYVRDFEQYLSATNTYYDIVAANDGFANLTAAEVALVNSEDGYDVEFDVRSDSESRLAVVGWSDEGRPSIPTEEGNKGVADAKSKAVLPSERLDISKLEALKGDWTASATIRSHYQDDSVKDTLITWKVAIGDLKADYELDEAGYKIYEEAGVSKEMADIYLAEFNELSAEYNTSVREQNRVLCQGWDIMGVAETSTANPWDLFLMPNYNTPSTHYLFYDFGPKWFLQVDADGNVFIPVNYNVVPPLYRWTDGMLHYLCNGNYEKGYGYYIKSDKPADAEDVQSVGIPVEISEDGNTVTLKSTVTTDGTNEIPLFPTVMYDYPGYGMVFYNPYSVSEVVLTKGWTEPTTPEPAPEVTPAKMSTRNMSVGDEGAIKTTTLPRSRTIIMPNKGIDAANVKVLDTKHYTKAERHQMLKEYMKRHNMSLGR